MSQIVRGSLGAIAIAATLGAAQFAVGGDLGQLHLNQQSADQASVNQTAAWSAVQDVNRAAKADRAAGAELQPGRTVAVELIGQSVLVRIPLDKSDKIGDAGPARAPVQPTVQQRRTMVACEPVVSVLTEVAKQLQPGRCVA